VAAGVGAAGAHASSVATAAMAALPATNWRRDIA